MALSYSVSLLVLTRDKRRELEERWPLLKILPYSLVALFLILPTVTGEIARGQISPWPWNAFLEEERRNGSIMPRVRWGTNFCQRRVAAIC
jgi:hypothetical protein